MSPRWATVGNANLYFYADEPHRRPHVDVIGPGYNVTIALDNLQVLTQAGKVPTKTLKQVLHLLRTHQKQAIAAYRATSE